MVNCSPTVQQPHRGWAIGVRMLMWAMLLLPSIGVAQPRTQFPTADPNWQPNAMVPVDVPPPTATLGAPTFDPFATSTQQAAPGFAPQQFPGSPLSQTPLYNGTEPYPSQAPPSVFSNGIVQPQVGMQGPSMRFLQAPRLRHSWLYGDGGNDLQINDIDMSLVFAWPNYLWTNQPLYVVPSFSLHLWDGPDKRPMGNMADLPGSAYSAFLDAGWESNPDMAVGGEVGARVGVFSSFDTFISDSIRIQGKGLIRLKLTPTVAIRGGVYYVDRLRVKLLPVGGLLWTPNPQTRFDIYFPSPKLSQYMTTLGNSELWWYIGAEYGGGSWTVKRSVNNLTEQIDINDIRLMMGIEWGASRFFQRGRRVGFFEIGWVTDREILYRDRPQDNLQLDDTIMIRAGFGY